jgi:hypothetical protein
MISNRVTDYILKRTGTTLGQLEGVVVSAGLTLDELYTALETVHRDKRITRRVIKGEIVYTPTPEPKAPTDYLKWVREHYPYPDKFIMPFPEIDMSFMFLRTKEERDAYKAEASGRPIWQKNKSQQYN